LPITWGWGLGDRVRVLVAEDCQDTALTYATFLKLAGYEVRVVCDGRAAVEAAVAERPDVAVVDIGLPVMTGLEVAEAIRQQPDLQGVRLIAVTGYGQRDDVRRGQEAGFDHYLVKPVDPADLLPLLTSKTA